MTTPPNSPIEGIPSISNTRASETKASDVPRGTIIERDLAYIASLGPGPMPWETSPREPAARFKEQDVP